MTAAELDRAVFQRVFGYLAAPGVNVPRFSADYDMATAILRHVEEALRPLTVEAKRRETTDPRLAWEVNIRIKRGPSGAGAPNSKTGKVVRPSRVRIPPSPFKSNPGYTIQPPDPCALITRIGRLNCALGARRRAPTSVLRRPGFTARRS